MAAFELDPLFVKALKLLHSKAKDSAEQLRQMHDDVIAQRKGLVKVKSEKSDSRSTSPAPSSSASRNAARAEDEKRRDAEKRSFEKLKQDLSELSQEPVSVKKIKVSSREHSPVIVKEEPRDSGYEHKDDERDNEKEKRRHRDKEKRDRHEKEKKHFEKSMKEKKQLEKRKDEEKSIKKKVFGSDDEDGDDNDDERDGESDKGSKRTDLKDFVIKEEGGEIVHADDFAFDLGISCVMCRSFDVSSVNQLIECQECHSLYHQECHRPTVTEQDVNDPRFVWYCSRCSKTLKKMVTKPSKGKSSVIVPAKMSSSSSVTSSSTSSGVTSSSISSSKNMSGSSSSTSSSSSGGIGSSSVPMTSLLKHAIKSEASTPLFPFRRVEPKLSSSSKDTGVTQSSKPLAGLAGWAANLSGKSSSTDTNKQKHSDQAKSSVKLDSLKPYKVELSRPSSASSSSRSIMVLPPLKTDQSDRGAISGSKLLVTKPSLSTSLSSKGISGGAAAVISADKRMQMMKKKAAAKIQDRKNSFK